MIKVKDGNISMSGTHFEILSDYTVIRKALLESDGFSDEDLKMADETAAKSEEEISEEIKAKKAELKKIFKMLIED